MLVSGLDVHKNFSQAIIMTEKGEIIKEAKIRTTREDILNFYSSYPEITIAMEACYAYEPIYEALDNAGYKVKLSHPSKTKAIAYAKVKTDRIDAKVLADLVRSGLLPEAYIPPKEIREMRRLCRERMKMVSERTRIKNRIRHELIRKGIRSEINLWSKEGMRWLKGLNIPAINRGIEIMEKINECIKEIDKEIERIAVRYEEEIRIL